MKETGLHCAACGKQTLHRQETPNHILHFLITFFTCGLWAIVWLVDSGKQRPWRCTFCGTANAVPVPPVAPVAPRPAPQPMSPRARRAVKRAVVAVLLTPFVFLGAVILWLLLLQPIVIEREAKWQRAAQEALQTEHITRAFVEARDRFGKVDGVIASSGGAYLLKTRDRPATLGFMVYLTPVLILEETGAFVLIEPLEGSMKGERGWVERVQIRRPGDLP
jgi:hypothetical protein